MYKLSQESVENLYIACMQAKDSKDRCVVIRPEELFAPWFVAQLPVAIRSLLTEHN